MLLGTFPYMLRCGETNGCSFLRKEKLEFSTLRHAKFSTMALLHLLHASNKAVPSRYPENRLPY